jgi:tight adherence protein C
VSPLLPGVAAACCVLLAGAGLRLLVVPGFDAPVLRRYDTAPATGSVTNRLFEAIGRRAVPLQSRLAPGRGHERLRRRLLAAGGPAGVGVGVDRFLARRAGGVLSGLLLGCYWIATGSTLVGIAVGGLLAGRADVALRLAVRRRRDEIERTLPDLLDVLSVTVLAGSSFRIGLARVAREFRGALPEDLLTTLGRMELGVDRRSAFEELRDRSAAPSLHKFVAAVLQAEELGSSLSGALADLATEMREAEGHRTRRRADSADKTVALITTLILLPGMVLLVLTVFFASLGSAG